MGNLIMILDLQLIKHRWILDLSFQKQFKVKKSKFVIIKILGIRESGIIKFGDQIDSEGRLIPPDPEYEYDYDWK